MKKRTWEVISTVGIVLFILLVLGAIVVSIVRDPDGNDGLQDLLPSPDSAMATQEDTTFEGVFDDSIIPKEW